MPNKWLEVGGSGGGGVNNRVGWTFPGYLISRVGGLINGKMENQKIMYLQ